MIAEQLSTPLYYLMISVMVLNLFQRKQMGTGGKKRFASLYLAGTLLALQVMVGLIASTGRPDWMLVPAFAVWGAILYLLRAKIFIFRLKCTECGGQLGSKEFLGRDDNRCRSCVDAEEAGEAGEASEAHGKEAAGSAGSGAGDVSIPVSVAPPVIDEEARHTLGKGEVRADIPRDVSGVDWDSWDFAEKAVLCYLFDGDKVMLIHKKTGLGKGKVNAPGGRIEADEMPADAAVRELQEETGVTPEGLREVALLHFIFTDGYSLKGTVFFAHSHQGEAQATDEADPFWVPVDQIPYEKMWEDDALWLPMALSGKHVTGRFIFEDEKMLSRDITTHPLEEHDASGSTS
jgi:8-oxo-dGTP diphosphatase